MTHVLPILLGLIIAEEPKPAPLHHFPLRELTLDIRDNAECLREMTLDGPAQLTFRVRRVDLLLMPKSLIVKAPKGSPRLLLPAESTEHFPTMTLLCNDDGKRSVQARYNVVLPGWKPSYRIVDDPTGKHQIQMWADIINPSGESWDKIRLTLIQDGKPIKYLLPEPVTLTNERSISLLVHQSPLEMHRLSITHFKTDPPEMRHAILMKAPTALPDGYLSVQFDDGFRSSGLIPDLEAKEETLFRLDKNNEIELAPPNRSMTSRLMRVRINKGVLLATTKQREVTLYAIANRMGTEQRIFIEHPVRPEWQLMGEVKPFEQTREVFRFDIKLEAGKSIRHEVAEEREVTESVRLGFDSEQNIRFYLSNPVTSDAVKMALKQILERMDKLKELETTVEKAVAACDRADLDQKGLKERIAFVPRESQAYTRYLKQFDTQEIELEAMNARIREQIAKWNQEKLAFEKFLLELSAE